MFIFHAKIRSNKVKRGLMKPPIHKSLNILYFILTFTFEICDSAVLLFFLDFKAVEAVAVDTPDCRCGDIGCGVDFMGDTEYIVSVDLTAPHEHHFLFVACPVALRVPDGCATAGFMGDTVGHFVPFFGKDDELYGLLPLGYVFVGEPRVEHNGEEAEDNGLCACLYACFHVAVKREEE